MKTIIALLGFLLMAVQAQAQSSYLVSPGDVLRIEVLEDQTLNREALVLPDGRISLPLAGLVQAGGRSIDQIQADIISRLAPNFATAPTVFVGIARLAQPEILAPGGAPAAPNTISVFMMGESASPGVINVEPGSTLLQVLAASGGFTPFAAKKRIQLRRGGEVYTFNYTEIEKLGGAGFQTVIAEGDVIVIPTRRLFE
jgi:polysaccharide export outer membrane protein